jgi:hypothetical protein
MAGTEVGQFMRPVADIIGDADNEIFEDNLLLINDAYQAVLGIPHVFGAHMHATAALWVRIQTSLKNAKWAT